MGQITKAASAKGGNVERFNAMLEQAWPRIAAVMPRHMTPERVYQVALSAYKTTPKLAECDPATVLSCLMQCTALGLEPSAIDGLGRAYLIPRQNHGRMEATFLLGYKGMLDLARRSGELTDISARAVREGDFFEYEFGLDERLRHIPSSDPVEGRAITHVYCVAHFKDGGHYIDVMSAEEVEAVRKRSEASKTGPWATDYEAMARKTVIRRAFPYLPVSVEAQRAAAADETTPRFVDSDGVIFSIGDGAGEGEQPQQVDAEVVEGV